MLVAAPAIKPIVVGVDAIPDAPAKKGWSMGCILGIIAIVLGGGGLVCCGGPLALTFFATNMVLTSASNQVKTEPAVVEHMGNLSKCSINLQKTGELHQDNHFVFDVQGTKGSGEVIVHVEPEGDHVRIISGTVKMSTGESFPFGAGGPPGGIPGMGLPGGIPGGPPGGIPGGPTPPKQRSNPRTTSKP